MKTELKELALSMPTSDQTRSLETFEVFRLMEDDGKEKVWEIRGFLNDLFPPLHFETKKEYMEYVKEWEWAFVFPTWEQIFLPGVGAYLTTLSDELASNEINQWLLDILFELRTHQADVEVVEKVKMNTESSLNNDSMPLYSMTIGVLLKDPRPILDVVYAPESLDYNNLREGLAKAMYAYMSQGHEQALSGISIPIVWNITQDRPNVFRRGDKCYVRFIKGTANGTIHIREEWMTSWAELPFNEIWQLWE